MSSANFQGMWATLYLSTKIRGIHWTGSRVTRVQSGCFFYNNFQCPWQRYNVSKMSTFLSYFQSIAPMAMRRYVPSRRWQSEGGISFGPNCHTSRIRWQVPSCQYATQLLLMTGCRDWGLWIVITSQYPISCMSSQWVISGHIVCRSMLLW